MFFVWVFFEFSWEDEVNWLLVIIKSYVKDNFKEINNNNTYNNNKWCPLQRGVLYKVSATKRFCHVSLTVVSVNVDI